MTTPTPTTKLSVNARGYLGAGLAIIIATILVDFYPEKLGKWTGTEWGSIALSFVQFGLFISAIAAFITVGNLIGRGSIGLKVKTIEVKGVKINFNEEKEELDE